MTRSLRKFVSRLLFGGNDAADAEREIALAVAARDGALRRLEHVEQQAAIVNGLLGFLRDRVAGLRATETDLRAQLSAALADARAARERADLAEVEAMRLDGLYKAAKIELLRRPARIPDPIPVAHRRIAPGTVAAQVALA